VSHVASPGKRKYESHSDSENFNRYNGGASPRGYDNSIQVMERELRSPDALSEEGFHAASNPADGLDESRTVTPGGDEPEVIHGVDPTLFGNNDGTFSGLEMQERSGMPMLSSRLGGEPTGTIDSMDLDQVMEDENTAEASAAVKHVDLA
jgi:hypothetical protein